MNRFVYCPKCRIEMRKNFFVVKVALGDSGSVTDLSATNKGFYDYCCINQDCAWFYSN